MSENGLIKFQEKMELANNCFKDISKEDIENFFGITLKSQKVQEKTLYNVYRGDELILPQMTLWDIENIFSDISKQSAELLCRYADKEDNPKMVNQKAKDLENSELEREQKDFRICPYCGQRYDSARAIHLCKYFS